MSESVKRLLARIRVGYGIAFALGALVSHYAGWTRSGRSPQWLTIGAYVAVVLACALAFWTLYRFRQLDKALRSEALARDREDGE